MRAYRSYTLCYYSAGGMELTEYLRERVDPERPTVGLWFYQTYWLNNNLAFIDALIRSLEAQGANVIPVFHLRHKDVERGNPGADYIVEHFFMDQRTPRIDVLISPMMFSLSLTAPEYRSLLDKLGVVCIQALLSMNSFAAWRDSEQGLGSMDVSFSAAQPEFDGNLISVPVATRDQETLDPVTGGLLTRYQPIPERVDKLVKLALNWARLRELKNGERRVARKLYPQVEIDKSLLYEVARSCLEVGVDGHRGDIIILKTARTLAAYQGHRKVRPEDVQQAAELALPHRIRRQPLMDIPDSIEELRRVGN